MNRTVFTFLLALFTVTAHSQSKDSLIINKIFGNALSSHESFNNLRYLCKHMPGRLAGTPQAAAAVEFTRQICIRMDLDSVFLQQVEVPCWKPGKTVAWYTSQYSGKRDVHICPLGNSVGTGENGLFAPVIEIGSWKELEEAGRKKIKGKIVFFNVKMDNALFYTMSAYGQTARYRVYGAPEAAKYGAVAVIVRSLTTSLDTFPHTGVMRYNDSIPKIPAMALSTRDAEDLSRELALHKDVDFYLKSTCYRLPPAVSYNVAGEIRGQKYPDEIIVVGGHLDAWFNTQGAHDDGVGCMHALDVLRIFKELDIKPQRTIRAVMFMDEEVNQSGGRVYAELAAKNNEKHIAAIESDAGGHVPLGFSFDADNKIIEKIQSYKVLFEPYNIYYFKKGYGGVDIRPLREQGVPCIGFKPDVQKYFEYHHSGNDTFEKVNRREMQAGSAAIASLVYLIDKYGL
jgi:carboxypeptidase Q